MKYTINMLELAKKIEELYPTNGYQKTANLLGISLFRLKNLIIKFNLKLERKRNVDISNFINLDKKEVCYFLGYFWSDGCLSRDEIIFLIKKNDGLILYNILSMFGKWNIFNKITKLNDKEYEQVVIYVNDKYIRCFLEENDFKIKSITTPTKILSKIPTHLIPYFFRGLIDGDGCFCSKNRNFFSITGDIRQDWTEVEKLFLMLNIKYKLTRKQNIKGNSSLVVISNKKDIIKLGDFIYGEEYDGIGLERKYKIYNEIKNKPISKYSSYK